MSHKIPDHTVKGVEGMYRPYWDMKRPGLPKFPEKPKGVEKRKVYRPGRSGASDQALGWYTEQPLFHQKTYEVAREMAMWTADFVRLEAAQRHIEIIDRVRALHKWTFEALNTIQRDNTKAIAKIGNGLQDTKAFKKLDGRLDVYKKAIEELKQINLLLTERIAQLEKIHRSKL